MQELRAISFFSNLPAEALKAVAVRLRPYEISSPQLIFQKGNSGRSMYFVTSGQVRIESPGGEPIAILGPGSFFGEMGLLLDSPRSADARAITPCELLILEMKDLEELMESHPCISIEIGRELSRRLANTSELVHKNKGCRLIGVVGQGLEALVAALRDSTGREPAVCSVLELVAGQANGKIPPRNMETAWVQMLETRFPHDPFVLLSIPDPTSEIGARAIAMCDQLIEMQRIQHPSSARARMHCDGSAASYARICRWITGTSTALAFSSGGSKTVAHLGVLKELNARKILIDGVSGSSGGALVAAGTAAGVNVEEQLVHLHELARALKIYRWDLNMVPRAAIIKGRRLRDMFDRWLDGRHFEDLPIPLYIAAADLDTGDTVILEKGSVADAIRASLSIPGVLDPWVIDGRVLIDGGVVDPLPGSILKEAGFGRVIGSNVAGKQFDVVRRTGGPNLVQIMTRMVHLMESRVVGAQSQYIDLMIRPRVSAATTFDFRMIGDFVEAGKRAAGSALDAWTVDITDQAQPLSSNKI